MSRPRSLGPGQARRMRELYAADIYSQGELARKYEVSRDVVRAVLEGRTYKEEGGPIHKPRPHEGLSDEQVRELREMYAAGGVTHKQAAAAFGIPEGTACGIINGATRLDAGGPITRTLNTITPEDAVEIRELCARKRKARPVKQIWRGSRWAQAVTYETFLNAATGKTFANAGGPIVETLVTGETMPIAMVREARRLAHAGEHPRHALKGQGWCQSTLKRALTGRGPYADITDPPPYLERLKPWRKK